MSAPIPACRWCGKYVCFCCVGCGHDAGGVHAPTCEFARPKAAPAPAPSATEGAEQTVVWFDAMCDGLNAAGLLHPKGRFVTTAEGRRAWVHPGERIE